MTCGLLLIETTKDSSARYFPLSQTIGDEYVFLFAISRTIAESSGRCYLLSRTMADKYVFHFFMSNRLSDGYPGRGAKAYAPARLSSTISPFAGHLVGRMQYDPTFPEKDKVSLGMCFLLSRKKVDKYVFHFLMYNRLLDRHPCRGVLHTPLARLSSIPTPFAGRLVGRMQYAPTLPEKERFPRVGITYCLRQSETNTYFISPCLIGYQMGTRVGAYCIRPLRVYRLPFRPLRGVW